MDFYAGEGIQDGPISIISWQGHPISLSPLSLPSPSPCPNRRYQQVGDGGKGQGGRDRAPLYGRKGKSTSWRALSLPPIPSHPLPSIRYFSRLGGTGMGPAAGVTCAWPHHSRPAGKILYASVGPHERKGALAGWQGVERPESFMRPHPDTPPSVRNLLCVGRRVQAWLRPVSLVLTTPIHTHTPAMKA